MTETKKTNVKNTVDVAKKHAIGVMVSSFFGYLIWSIIYAGVIFGAAWYAIQETAYPDWWFWIGATALYILVLVVSFILRIRGLMNSFKEAALDAAEEVITTSDNKTVRAGSKGFKIFRWFVG